jgi:hypothetical protein
MRIRTLFALSAGAALSGCAAPLMQIDGREVAQIGPGERIALGAEAELQAVEPILHEEMAAYIVSESPTADGLPLFPHEGAAR